MMLTLQGCTSSHTLSPLIAVYSTCTRQPSSGSPARVSATAYLNTQVSSPGLSPIRVPSAGSPAEVSTNGPERCEQGSRDTKRANRYTVPRAYRNTAHPDGQHRVRPPAYYKHQKLLCNSWTEDKCDQEAERVHWFRAQCMVVTVSWITNTELSS